MRTWSCGLILVLGVVAACGHGGTTAPTVTAPSTSTSVAAAEGPVVLSITPPTLCTGFLTKLGAQHAFDGSLTPTPTGYTFVWQPLEVAVIPPASAATLQPSTLAFDLARPEGSGAFVFGTFSSYAANDQAGLLVDIGRFISGTAGGDQPQSPPVPAAPLTGLVAGDGTLSGTLDGQVAMFVRNFAAFSTGGCVASGFTWSIVSRR